MNHVYLVLGIMAILAAWGGLVPMPALLLGLLMLVEVGLAAWVASTLLIVKRAQGVTLPPTWRQRLRRLQKLGWLVWVVRLGSLSLFVWFGMQGAYAAAAFVIATWGLLAFLWVFVDYHLKQWSADR